MRITQLFAFHFYLRVSCPHFQVITIINDLVWSSSPLVPTPYRGFKSLLLVLSLLRSSGLKALPWGRRSLNRIRFACIFKFCLGVLQKHLTWKKNIKFFFLQSGLYFDQRNYSSLRHSKPVSTYYYRVCPKSLVSCILPTFNTSLIPHFAFGLFVTNLLMVWYTCIVLVADLCSLSWVCLQWELLNHHVSNGNFK